MNSHFQSHVSSSSSSSLSENEDETQNDSQEQELVVAYIIQQDQGTHRGSIPGHVVIHRDGDIANRNLFNDYCDENSPYNEAMFRRRFRMSRNLFLRIVAVVKNHDAYFTQRNDGVGRLDLSTIQKTTTALRILAYDLPADATDEYIKIGESTAIECMQRFCRDIVEVFAERYLRSPTSNDVARLLYYLVDDIYLKWSTIVQSIHYPRGLKKKYFAMKKEFCRKEVERAFGVLQLRFTIVASPVRGWKKRHLHDIMKSCIIMHNMIIKDERDLCAPIQDVREAPTPDVKMAVDEHIKFQEFLSRYKRIKDKDAHFALRNALIDHLWDEYSHSNV